MQEGDAVDSLFFPSLSFQQMKALASIAARDGYPMTLPIFGLGHSLGSKLQVGHHLPTSGPTQQPQLAVRLR